MSKLGILGVSALSLTLAVAAPAFAAERGSGGGAHATSTGTGGGMQASSGGFRGAQASIGAGPAATVSGGSFAGRSGGQFVQGGGQGDHGFRQHRFGPGFGFAAGLAAGSTLGYGYYDPNYYDDYAYNESYDEYPGYVVSSVADPAYCAQRYRSFDPASGTYLGYDGLRHPCGE